MRCAWSCASYGKPIDHLKVTAQYYLVFLNHCHDAINPSSDYHLQIIPSYVASIGHRMPSGATSPRSRGSAARIRGIRLRDRGPKLPDSPRRLRSLRGRGLSRQCSGRHKHFFPRSLHAIRLSIPFLNLCDAMDLWICRRHLSGLSHLSGCRRAQSHFG